MSERIDILMATYNGENFIRDQIHSILNQTHQNFRLLISDDHSKDSTRNIIQEFIEQYPEKIFQISSEKKLGAKENFSFLMQHAEADYIMFSDQDDIWIKEKVALALAKMKSLEELHGKNLPILVHGDLTVVDKNCSVINHSFWSYTNLNANRFHTINRFLMQNVVTGCTMMINKHLNILSFPIPNESMMHDWWIALVASTFGKIGVIQKPSILYRQHGTNTLGAKRFTLLNFLKNGFKWYFYRDPFILEQVKKRVIQATAFFKRYEHKLKSDQKIVVQDYIKLKSSSFLTKRILVLKHRFFRSGFTRNFFTFIFKLEP